MFGGRFHDRRPVPRSGIAWRRRRLRDRLLWFLLSGLAVAILPGDGIWIPLGALVSLTILGMAGVEA